MLLRMVQKKSYCDKQWILATTERPVQSHLASNGFRKQMVKCLVVDMTVLVAVAVVGPHLRRCDEQHWRKVHIAHLFIQELGACLVQESSKLLKSRPLHFVALHVLQLVQSSL